MLLLVLGYVFVYIVFQFCFTFHFLFDDIMISLHCCRLLGVWNVVLLLVRLFHTVDRLSISHLNSPYHIILCREKIYCITFLQSYTSHHSSFPVYYNR